MREDRLVATVSELWLSPYALEFEDNNYYFTAYDHNVIDHIDSSNTLSLSTLTVRNSFQFMFRLWVSVRLAG